MKEFLKIYFQVCLLFIAIPLYLPFQFFGIDIITPILKD